MLNHPVHSSFLPENVRLMSKVDRCRDREHPSRSWPCSPMDSIQRASPIHSKASTPRMSTAGRRATRAVDLLGVDYFVRWPKEGHGHDDRLEGDPRGSHQRRRHGRLHQSVEAAAAPAHELFLPHGRLIGSGRRILTRKEGWLLCIAARLAGHVKQVSDVDSIIRILTSHCTAASSSLFQWFLSNVQVNYVIAAMALLMNEYRPLENCNMASSAFSLYSYTTGTTFILSLLYLLNKLAGLIPARLKFNWPIEWWDDFRYNKTFK